MAKCVRCGGSFLTRFKIKLKDAYICRQCTLELGFDKDFYLRSSLYSWDDIKDGKDAYIQKQRKKEVLDNIKTQFRIAHYGEKRELDCTDEEREIFDIISENIDRSVQLVRKSDSYVTILCGEWDLVRLKFTERAKWILFPAVDRSDAKIYIDSPEDVLQYLDKINDSIACAEKYSKQA